MQHIKINQNSFCNAKKDANKTSWQVKQLLVNSLPIELMMPSMITKSPLSSHMKCTLIDIICEIKINWISIILADVDQCFHTLQQQTALLQHH